MNGKQLEQKVRTKIMTVIAECILLVLAISLALMGNVLAWMLLYDNIKERIKNKKHDKH